MKLTKKTFRIFTVADWEAEEKYLREMHRRGWKLRKGGVIYTFDRCEPEDVVYQLDYNPEGLKHRNDYLQLFKDCGWEYVQTFNEYSYFRKPADELADKEEGIFCDDSSKLDMVRRVWMGRMLPLMAIFLLLIVPNLMNGMLLGSKIITALYWIFFAIYVAIFVKFGVKFCQMRARWR